MKHLKITLFLLINILFINSSYGQLTYGNEWINYSQTYYKVKVFNNGIHRITINNLETNGVNFDNPNTLQLFKNGVEQPIYVHTNNDDIEYIEFYGEKNDGFFDKFLYTDSLNHTNPYYSLYSDTSIYFLTNGTSNGLRYENINTNLVNTPIKETNFTQEDIISFNQVWDSGTKYLFAGVTFNKSFYEIGEGWGSGSLSDFSYDYVLNTSIDTQTIEIEMGVTYVGNVNHSPTIKIGEQIINSESFFGETTKKIKFFSNIYSNELNIKLTGNGEKYIISYIKIKYKKEYDFNNQESYVFNVDTDNQRKLLEIDNFKNENNSQEIYLYDLTSKKRIHCFWTGSKVLTDLTPSNETKKLVLINNNENSYIITPKMDEVQFTDYSNHNGDLLIVKHKKIQYYDNRDLIIEYATHKSSLGFNPVVIDIEEVINQFGYGINNHPQSLRNLYKFVNDNWGSLDYIFLIGKGRVYNEVRQNNTYDNMIPTYGQPASDNLLFSQNGNLIPFVSIGRLSVSNSEQFKIYLDKLFTAEKTKPNLWDNKIIHLIGGNGANEQLVFKNAMMTMESTAMDMGYNVNSFSHLIDNDKNIYDEINSGSALMTYLGHANPMNLEFEGDSIEAYNNNGKYPFFVSLSCKNGNYFAEGEQMSEKFIFAENKGFVGYLGFSTDVALTGAVAISNELYKQLDITNLSVGDMIKNSVANLESVTNYNFFIEMAIHSLVLHGDPTYKIKKYEIIDETPIVEENVEEPISYDVIEPKIYNYPNPVINSTQFHFSLDESVLNVSEINVEIYDTKGQLVKRFDNNFFTKIDSGTFLSENWNVMDELGRTLTTGIYFYNVIIKDEFGNYKLFTPKSNIQIIK